jgi:hypothetical protein
MKVKIWFQSLQLRILLVPPYAEVPNGDMRLFGGAQYHRALEEFRATVSNVQCPVVGLYKLHPANPVDTHSLQLNESAWSGFNP